MLPAVILFFLGALAVAVLGGQSSFPSISTDIFQTANISQAQQTYQENAPQPRPTASNNSYVSPAPVKPTPVSSVSINTFIKFGPQDKEVVDETNRVAFEFGAEVLPADTEGQITFETKMEGVDADWKQTYGTQRTVELPVGPKEYTFLVRARINDIVDLTPAKRTFKLNVSPYFGKVKISSVTPPDNRANPSLIVLRAEIEEKEKIDITGWKFEGEKGNFIIPRGIEDYNPITLSYPLKDIVIKKGDTVYISSASNPLGPKNFNFRVNKCMGYIVSFNQFEIPISKNCPSPQILPESLCQDCQDYISHLGTCQIPTYQGMKDYDILKDDACRSWLDLNLNYAGCYRNYYRDQNFWQNQWHIYLDRAEKEIMDMSEDTIYLRDGNGLLVDKYSYGGTRAHGSYFHYFSY